MPEQKRLSLAGIGCGSRTRTYMKLAMEQKDRYRICLLYTSPSPRDTR